MGQFLVWWGLALHHRGKTQGYNEQREGAFNQDIYRGQEYKVESQYSNILARITAMRILEKKPFQEQHKQWQNYLGRQEYFPDIQDQTIPQSFSSLENIGY